MESDRRAGGVGREGLSTHLFQRQRQRTQHRRVLAPHRAPIHDVMTLLQRQNDIRGEERVAERHGLELTNQQQVPATT